MPDLTSGQIRFDGLGSGMDFDQIVNQMVQIEGRRIQRLQQDMQQEQVKMEASQELQNSMVSMRSEMDSMNTLDDFFIRSAESGQESVASASADSSAEEGSYNLEVGQLARNHIMFSNEGFAETDDPVNDSGEARTFSYQYGPEEGEDAHERVDLEVPDGTTLQGLVELINEDPDNPGVRATLINDGNEYFLQLKGMDQGADYKVEIKDEETDLDGFKADDFDTSQEAQNSKIKVDGWPRDEVDEDGEVTEERWIERDSNSVDDVIEGVTLNLYETGETQITVSDDHEAIKEQVQEFVDSVNNVLAMMQGVSRIEEDEEAEDDDMAGPQTSLLTGNYGVRMVQDRIRDVLASAGVGFDRDDDPFPNLGTIGISTVTDEEEEDYGLLRLDESRLDEVLDEDPQAVAEIFSADNEPSTDTSDFRFASQIEGTTRPGLYDVSYTMENGEITNAYIDGEEARFDNQEMTISSRSGDSRGLVIRVDNLSDGEYQGNVRLKQGKAGELSDAVREMTDPESGTFKIMERGYESTIQSLERSIESEQSRLSRYERDLRSRFARTEQMLGRYEGMQQSIFQMRQQLG